MSSNHPNKDKSQNQPATPETAKNDGQPTTTTTQNKDEGKESSLLSRIQNSASSLIQDSLTRPGGATLSSDLAHVLHSGNKGSSSSASFSGLTHSGQTWRSNGSSSAGNNQDGYASGLSEGFRSSQLRGGNGLEGSEFDSFQNAGGFFQTVDQDAFINEISDKGKGKGKSREYDNDIDHGQDMILDINDDYESSYFNAYEMAWINASRLGTVYKSTTSTPSKRLSQSSQSDTIPFTPQTQIKNEDENDGAEVVNLLSDPSFQPGLTTWADENQDTFNTTHDSGFGSGLGFDLDLDDDPLDAEGFPHTLAMSLSPTEIQILDSFRRQHAHQTDHEKEVKKRITPYSLIPDIDSFLTQSDTTTTASASKTDDDALRNEVITNLIGAEEWLHVDERYNDDVWGYLRPAVEAAAAEIQQQQQNEEEGKGGDGDGPAVKRLKMILRHMARL